MQDPGKGNSTDVLLIGRYLWGSYRLGHHLRAEPLDCYFDDFFFRTPVKWQVARRPLHEIEYVDHS
jgi:hypothetical protein